MGSFCIGSRFYERFDSHPSAGLSAIGAARNIGVYLLGPTVMRLRAAHF
jgi:hypothetical protein